MINIPWLETDKLDASISIKGVAKKQYFTSYYLKRNGDGSGDIKITTWFKPKYVEIYSIYPGRFASCNSRTIINTDWELQTMMRYNNDTIINIDIFWTWIWDANSIPCVYIFRDWTRTQLLYMKSFDSDGFTMKHGFNWINDAWLHILAIW